MSILKVKESVTGSETSCSEKFALVGLEERDVDVYLIGWRKFKRRPRTQHHSARLKQVHHQSGETGEHTMATDVIVMQQTKPEDPDAQATITDFLDYTEYLPSDLTRSLTLIGKLDETYLERADRVHVLSKQYGTLPKLPSGNNANPQALRSQISSNLDQAIRARESAYGEAERLYEMVNRHYNRLVGIQSKLHALPKPPSRDPTPVPRSPQATRKTPPPRITLRLDAARAAASAGRATDNEKKVRYRNRRVTVPGEVLPPPNPDSPQALTDSDWESIPPSPLPMPTSRVGGSRPRHKPPRIRPPKPPKIQKERTPRPPRPPGTGTNVHSSVAGISTSNALSMLPKPPPDAKLGSEHAPWMRLTEYEMALLRKRMKKNAIWTPSETMIRRELADAGRGPDNYRKKKAEAEEAGEEFVDIDNIATTAPGKPLAPGEISADALGLASTNLSNRGMKLNEAKKQKREQMLLASLQETEQAAKRLETLGSNFKELFKKPSLSSPLTPSLSMGDSGQKDKLVKKKKKAVKEEAKEDEAPAKKRKRDESPNREVNTVQTEPTASLSNQTSKKSKTQIESSTSTVTTTITTSVPLAASAPSPSKCSHQRSRSPTPATPDMPAPEKPKPPTQPSKATATSSRPRRVSLTLKGPTSPPPADPTSRPPSRASRRDSTAPLSATLPRDHPRRKSATPATPTTPAANLTAAARRSKRPAPGTVMQCEEGGATVSKGAREKPPKKDKSVLGAAAANSGGKKVTAADREKVLKAEEAAAGELVDPDEPRYCLCGDVSWGDMICCDNDNTLQRKLQPSSWLINRALVPKRQGRFLRQRTIRQVISLQFLLPPLYALQDIVKGQDTPKSSSAVSWMREQTLATGPMEQPFKRRRIEPRVARTLGDSVSREGNHLAGIEVKAAEHITTVIPKLVLPPLNPAASDLVENNRQYHEVQLEANDPVDLRSSRLELRQLVQKQATNIVDHVAQPVVTPVASVANDTVDYGNQKVSVERPEAANLVQPVASKATSLPQDAANSLSSRLISVNAPAPTLQIPAPGVNPAVESPDASGLVDDVSHDASHPVDDVPGLVSPLPAVAASAARAQALATREALATQEAQAEQKNRAVPSSEGPAPPLPAPTAPSDAASSSMSAPSQDTMSIQLPDMTSQNPLSQPSTPLPLSPQATASPSSFFLASQYPTTTTIAPSSPNPTQSYSVLPSPTNNSTIPASSTMAPSSATSTMTPSSATSTMTPSSTTSTTAPSSIDVSTSQLSTPSISQASVASISLMSDSELLSSSAMPALTQTSESHTSRFLSSSTMSLVPSTLMTTSAVSQSSTQSSAAASSIVVASDTSSIGVTVGGTPTLGSTPATSTSAGAGSGSGNGNGTPPTRVLVGGIVGGIAGAVLILVALLFLLRWRRGKVGQRRNISPPVPQTAGAGSAALGGSESGMMTQRSSSTPIAAAGFFGRLRPSSSQTAATTDTSAPSERGFQKISGRKLPSVLQSGGDGYGGAPAGPSSGPSPMSPVIGGASGPGPVAALVPALRPSTSHSLSGSSFYRDSQGFYGGVVPAEPSSEPTDPSASPISSSPTISAPPSTGAPLAATGRSPDCSSPGIPNIRPGPARQPVINQGGVVPMRTPSRPQQPRPPAEPPIAEDLFENRLKMNLVDEITK
ncbi:MAG: hypothetical protein Q9217_001711 [Psora testacea]